MVAKPQGPRQKRGRPGEGLSEGWRSSDTLRGSKGNRPIDYWVPLVYYAPWLEGRTVERVTQHIDILPTVIELMGHTDPFFAFGHTAFGTTVPPFSIWSNNGIYTITGDVQQVQFDGERILGVVPIADGSAPDAVLAAEMELHLKAAVQQFNGRMNRSELTIKPQLP